tara:strand:- start:828 stop:1049 length:222 start_codon:yes stop_codon:yes gene_type:complete
MSIFNTIVIAVLLFSLGTWFGLKIEKFSRESKEKLEQERLERKKKIERILKRRALLEKLAKRRARFPKKASKE